MKTILIAIAIVVLALLLPSVYSYFVKNGNGKSVKNQLIRTETKKEEGKMKKERNAQ